MEEKRNVNISFKTTASNKLEWTKRAKECNMSLSEFIHCATQLYNDQTISKIVSLEAEIATLKKELSKAKNETANAKLTAISKEEHLKELIHDLEFNHELISVKYENAVNRIAVLEDEKETVNKRIEEYANKCTPLQIGLFSKINSDEIRALKS